LQPFDYVLKQHTFLRTPPRSPTSPKHAAVVIDCEMGINWLHSMDLIQLCVAEFFSGVILYTSIIKPLQSLLHLNTPYSGVSQEQFDMAVKNNDVLKSWEEARSALFQFVDAETVLIGHDLRNDLWHLRTIHGRIVDTSVICKTPNGGKRGLESLAWEVGGLRIRDKEKGFEEHSVAEDTLAARQVLLRVLMGKAG
jgi:hypothetical protein